MQWISLNFALIMLTWQVRYLLYIQDNVKTIDTIFNIDCHLNLYLWFNTLPTSSFLYINFRMHYGEKQNEQYFAELYQFNKISRAIFHFTLWIMIIKT